MIEFFMIGNLGADAVMNDNNGMKILNFNICHSEVIKNRSLDTKEVKKHWVDCAYYSDSKELLEMLKKGVQVYVKGFPHTKVHMKDGTPSAIQYLKVSKVEVLSKKKKEESF